VLKSGFRPIYLATAPPLKAAAFGALHELEALQTRRTGGAPSLAWLDLDGLAGS
jgi:hypothetical protein